MKCAKREIPKESIVESEEKSEPFGRKVTHTCDSKRPETWGWLDKWGTPGRCDGVRLCEVGC